MSNYKLSDQDKEKLRQMNCFEGYQCERDPAYIKLGQNGANCKTTLGIEIENCLVCPGWKAKKEEIDDEDD